MVSLYDETLPSRLDTLPFSSRRHSRAVSKVFPPERNHLQSADPPPIVPTRDGAVASAVADATVVYGGVLVDAGVTVLACGERRSPAFLTATGAARRDLDRFLGELEDELGTDLGRVGRRGEPSRDAEISATVHDRERATALTRRARAVALHLQTADGRWRRVRETDRDAFASGESLPALARLARLTSEDARRRIAARPPAVVDRLAEALDHGKF